jgi:hypothetical protein
VLPGVGTPQGGVALGRASEASGETVAALGLIAEMLGHLALGRVDSMRSAGRRLNAIFPSQQFVAFAQMLDASVILFDDAYPIADAARAIAMLQPLTRAMMPPAVRRDAAWMLALAALRRRDPDAARGALAFLADEAPPFFRKAFVGALLVGAAGQPDSALTLTLPIVTDLEAWDRDRGGAARCAPVNSPREVVRGAGYPGGRAQRVSRHEHFHLPDYPVDNPLPSDGDWAFSTLASGARPGCSTMATVT